MNRMRFELLRLHRRSSTHSLVKFTLYKRSESTTPIDSAWEERIMSGIQPTGVLHIGNYFGAVKNWVNLQNSNRNVICTIADLHSMTLPYNVGGLSENILLMAASLIACGIDPGKSILFLQSQVPQHVQLFWVLGCLATAKQLEHLPNLREKTESSKSAAIQMGLLVYPILQAADILIYKATKVPVGRDQLQHLHLSSQIAKKFNAKFGETFPVPQPILNDFAVKFQFVFEDGCSSKIKNLLDPTVKMSKSCTTGRSRIDILDSPDSIKLKLQKATTDMTSRVSFEPEQRPGVSNLVGIHSAIVGKDVQVLCQEVQHLDTGQYKMLIADLLIETLLPIQSEIGRLMNDKHHLSSVLNEGTRKATELASETWNTVSKKIGISVS